MHVHVTPNYCSHVRATLFNAKLYPLPGGAFRPARDRPVPLHRSDGPGSWPPSFLKSTRVPTYVLSQLTYRLLSDVNSHADFCFKSTHMQISFLCQLTYIIRPHSWGGWLEKVAICLQVISRADPNPKARNRKPYHLHLSEGPCVGLKFFNSTPEILNLKPWTLNPKP